MTALYLSLGMNDLVSLTIIIPILFSLFVFSRPKGVMTSYKAMTDTTKGITKLLSITSSDRYISYLPIAHGMERWLGMVRFIVIVFRRRTVLFNFYSSSLTRRFFFKFVVPFLRIQCLVRSTIHWNATLVCRGSYNFRC
jgi:hypothetical protein